VAYTIAISAVIYPVVAGVTWGGGFLGGSGLGFTDFAGGMIVHGVGGIAGLTAAYMLGPRMDRYAKDGSTNVIPGHSMTFAVLGTLILAFGWYGFNVGTTATVFSVTESGELALGGYAAVGRVALTTTLGMGAGAVGAALGSMYLTKKVDTLYVANGVLAGLVAVTGIANLATWWGAILVALVCGLQLPLVFEFVSDKMKIDDVCAVFPVHGSAGVRCARAAVRQRQRLLGRRARLAGDRRRRHHRVDDRRDRRGVRRVQGSRSGPRHLRTRARRARRQRARRRDVPRVR